MEEKFSRQQKPLPDASGCRSAATPAPAALLQLLSRAHLPRFMVHVMRCLVLTWMLLNSRKCGVTRGKGVEPDHVWHEAAPHS